MASSAPQPTVNMSLSILLAEDHVMIREAIRNALEKAGYQVVAEASTGEESIRMGRELRPDIALLDLSLPTFSGLDAGYEITRNCPQTKLVMLTMHTEEPYVLAALRTGFRGYVLKSQPLEELIQAIAQVSTGGIYLSPAVSVAVVEAWKSGSPGRVLPPRERQTLQLISEGYSTKEIADRLGISVKTAESHRARLMAKLGLHTTAELVRYAIRSGLVQP